MWLDLETNECIQSKTIIVKLNSIIENYLLSLGDGFALTFGITDNFKVNPFNPTPLCTPTFNE